MLLGRFESGGRVRYGIHGGTTVELLGDSLPEPGASGEGEVVRSASVRVLAPVEPSKIVAVGRNYTEHAAAMGLEVKDAPSVFLKPLQSIVPEGVPIVLPPLRLSTHVEHEGEIAVVIGRRAHRVPAEDVHAYVLGLTCANDVSARDLQKTDPQITRGKGFDTFCPLGPFVETDASIDEDRGVTCSVNGLLRQSSSAGHMIYGIRTIVEFVSEFTTLEPGDVILTGSPGGTERLRPGDAVEVSVEGVGTLRNTVEADPEDRAGTS